jgi:hypothetical protein
VGFDFFQVVTTFAASVKEEEKGRCRVGSPIFRLVEAKVDDFSGG